MAPAVTVKPLGGEGSVQPRVGTAAVSLPSAPQPPIASAPPPMAPAAPRPPAIPGAPPAATVPMAPMSAPKIETGATTVPIAKTVPLKPMSPASRPAAGGTSPLGAAGGAGAPKATVKLQQTQPMSRPSISAPPSAPVKRTSGSDTEALLEDEKDPEEGLLPLSLICLLLSVGLLAFQALGSDRVASEDGSGIKVPQPNPAKWERLNVDHTWTNDFDRFLPPVTK